MGNSLIWFSRKKCGSLDSKTIGSLSCAELYKLLQELTEQADRMSASSVCPHEQYQELAITVSEIGDLLQELMAAKPATGLTPLFLLLSGLQGRVREMRYDLGGSHTC